MTFPHDEQWILSTACRNNSLIIIVMIVEFEFFCSERREGPAKVRVVVKGNQITGTSHLHYESSCELISDMMQLYIHAMNHLFSLVLSKSLISNSELDVFLFKIFSEDEPKGILPKAFEELFGIYRYNMGG